VRPDVEQPFSVEMGRLFRAAYRTAQLAVAVATTVPAASSSSPWTLPFWMNDAAIAVAPAAMSPRSESKSNSTSSATDACAAAVALFAPDVMRA
jgi:hypothetical protein